MLRQSLFIVFPIILSNETKQPKGFSMPCDNIKDPKFFSIYFMEILYVI